MSPDLFNLYNEVILQELKDTTCVIVGGYMNNVRYADDTSLICDNEQKLQNSREGNKETHCYDRRCIYENEKKTS